jgi:serpin B
MMHQRGKFCYAEDEKVQVLRMGYEGSDLDMFVFLPKQRFGLDAWLQAVDGAGLQKLMLGCGQEEVRVTLPKWKVETSFDLNDQLQALGMKDAFHPDNANFNRMIGDPDREQLFISKVIHKAFIEVTEKGTQASAATAVVVVDRCRDSPSFRMSTFIAEHPFLVTLAICSCLRECMHVTDSFRWTRRPVKRRRRLQSSPMFFPVLHLHRLLSLRIIPKEIKEIQTKPSLLLRHFQL